eukprot:6480384-Amphidinium_carterae.1
MSENVPPVCWGVERVQGRPASTGHRAVPWGPRQSADQHCPPFLSAKLREFLQAQGLRSKAAPSEPSKTTLATSLVVDVRYKNAM